MNNQNLLDEDFEVENPLLNKKVFSEYQFDCKKAVESATLWRYIGFVAVAIIGFLFFAHHSERSNFSKENIEQSFFAGALVLLASYFTHFFALQKQLILIKLFPQINHKKPKTYNVEFLFGLAVVFRVLSQLDFSHIGVVFNEMFWFANYVLCINFCCLGIQQLLLKRYEVYFPAFFDGVFFPSIGFVAFPSIGYMPLLCFLTAFVSLIIGTVFIPKLGIIGQTIDSLTDLVFFTTFVAVVLAFLYVMLHSQAEKHYAKINKVKL